MRGEHAGVIGRGKKEKEEWPVLTKDSFKMNTFLLAHTFESKKARSLIVLGLIPPGENIISNRGH